MKRAPCQKQIILCLILSSFVFSMPCAYARPLILSIDAHSDDGTQMGTFIGVALKKNFPDLEKQYDRYLAFLLSPAQFKQLLPKTKALKAVVDPTYQAEVTAIAAAWQLNARDHLGDGRLSLDEFWLLQLLPDLTAINKGSAFAAANRSEQNPIAARNLDWKGTADLKSLQTISIYEYENRTVVTIGFAGLVGVISGFNDQGLFVSLMDASELKLANALLPQHVISFELRSILKDENKIAAASQKLAQNRYLHSQQVLLADTEDIAVLEQPAGLTGTLRQTDSIMVNEMPWNNQQLLAVVNCLVLKTSPNHCYTSKDYYHWGRLAQLSKQLPEQGVSISDVAAIMQDQANAHQAIFNADTLQTIIFTPKDRSLYLAAPADIKTDTKPPLLEKYQFIKTRSGLNDELLNSVWLLVAASLVAGFIYVFDKKKKKSLTID